MYADIGVCTPISAYCDIDTDIGADFNDTRYRAGIPDIGYIRYRDTRYRPFFLSRYLLPSFGIPILENYPISCQIVSDIGYDIVY